LKRVLLTLFVLALVAGLAPASSDVRLNNETDVLSVDVVSAGLDRTVIRYRVGSFTMSGVAVGGRDYTKVLLGDESNTLERGLPELPTVARSIAIPGDAGMEVRVLSSHYVEFNDVDVLPSRGSIPRNVDPASVEYEFAPFYESDGWYPGRLVEARDPYIMRAVRGMVVVLNPFSYNPSTRILRVYDEVVVEAVRVGRGSVNLLDGPAMAAPQAEFDRIYERHFLNYREAVRPRYAPVGEVGEMLIIAYDAFMPSMEPFVDWKLQMGIPCEMVGMSEVGTTSEDVAAYIADYYDSNDLTYVLLVGDGAQVPTLQHGGASDPSYTLLAGDDTYPDIFVGRFSAESEGNVATQVLRSVEYEKTPQVGGDWYHRATGIASDQGPGDDMEFDDEHVDNIRLDLLGSTYTEVDQIYDPTASAAEVITVLNEGRGVINYTGHGHTMGWGSSGFDSGDVNALTNDNMLPFIWSVACLNGNFDDNNCFAEAWMRATNGGEPTGAIGTYMSSINQDWDEPMDAQDEMVDLLVAGAKRTLGGLSFNGSCHMLDEYGLAAEDDFLAWHLFGDPSLRVRTDTPTVLSVDHADTVAPTSWTFDVTVAGVEGALCALYRDGVSYGSAFTDASGVATISVNGVLPSDQDVTVTVTAPNALPYFGSFRVSQAYTPILDVSPADFDVRLAPDETRSDSLRIGNAGEELSILHYEISVVDAGMSRSVNSSRVSMAPSAYVAGVPTEYTLELYNGSSEGQWINGASLSFPDSVVINSCSDFTVADRKLSYDGASSGNSSAVWAGDWWNVVYPGETALASVNITVGAAEQGDVEALYGLTGDGHGSPPHAMSGTADLTGTGPSVLTVLSPNGHEVWGVGETRDVTWEPTGGPIYVNICCSTDGGETWYTAVSGTPDDGHHEWTVDAPVSDNCLLRVCLSVDESVGDTGDASFSVYQPVEWLTVAPLSGDVPADADATHSVELSSVGLVPGDYAADIVITSNGGPPLAIPVELSVGEEERDTRVPEVATLYGSYPNPFNPVTRIAFSVPRTTRVTISIFTVGGRLVRVLVDDLYGAGRHSEPWDGRDEAGARAASGVYVYRVEAGSRDLWGRMVLIK
jgi:hypothetical protein